MIPNRLLAILLVLITLLMSSFTEDNTCVRNDDQFIVVLDAGHGGHDPGNLGNGYLEKSIALNIVLTVGAILEKNPNIKVVYTRKDDTFIDLYVRGEIANKANADLFVSVHCDSHNSDAYGAGTFVLGLHANKQNFEIAKKENSVIYLEDDYESRYADYDINSPESVVGLTIMQEEFLDQSISLAKTIQDNFTGKLKRKNREVKQAGFIVLHQTFMPSVLVETGFLTNDKEGAYLNSKKGQIEMGTAIADAILTYKGGVSSSLSQAPQKVVMKAPDPDKEITSTTPVVSKTAEEISKDSEVNPNTAKPMGDEVITEKVIDKPLGIATKTPESTKIVKKEELPIAAGKEVIKNEQPKIVEAVKEAIEAPEPILAQKNEVVKPVAKQDIEFRVQLMAGSKNLALEPSNFKGLDKLSKEPIKNLYRYMYGSTGSYKAAELLKKTAGQKGYSSSYIVAYKNGVRIPTLEAIKMVSE